MTAARSSLDRRTVVCRTPAAHSLNVDIIGGDVSTPRPCILWLHGGGLIFGSRTMSPRPFLAEALLDHGFVIASADYPLAPEVKLEGILHDLQSLWQWIHESGPSLFGADPRRVCIAGASAGAYLSLLAGYQLTPRPKAIASLWGFGDITAPWEAEPSEHYRKAPLVSLADATAALSKAPIPTASGEDRSLFYLYCRQQGAWLQEVTGHALPDGQSWLRRYCPTYQIEPDFPPTILVHGQIDNDVPASESDRLVEVLRDKGVRHAYHSLPGVGHGFAGASMELVQSTECAVAAFLSGQLATSEA
jgi:acetyl esterase/lipase